MEWNELRHIRRLSLKSKWTLTFQNVNIDNLAGNNATKNKNKEEEEVKKPRDLTGSDSVIPSQNRTEQNRRELICKLEMLICKWDALYLAFSRLAAVTTNALNRLNWPREQFRRKFELLDTRWKFQFLSN